MIYALQGTIITITNQGLVVNIHGCAFEVAVPYPHKYALAQEVSLQTFFHWNPEQGPQLFGFATGEERSLFAWIITCQGIGPKLGLTILQHLSVMQCIEALQQGNAATLSAVKGLGAKKAEVLILHARSKREFLSQLYQQAAPITGAGTKQKISTVYEDVYQALQTLRYSSAEVTPLLQNLYQDSTLYEAPFDVVMRKALTLLAKQK